MDGAKPEGGASASVPTPPPVPVFELDFWTAAWLLVALALQHAAAAAGSRAGC